MWCRWLSSLIVVGLWTGLTAAAGAEQYAVEYWAENEPQRLKPLEVAAPSGIISYTLDALPLVQTTPTVLRLGDAAYVLDQEGLYRVRCTESAKVVRQTILCRSDAWRLAGHLSRLYVYGTRHVSDGQAKWDERARNGEPISLQCGYVAAFVQHHLEAQNIPSRLVSCVAGSDWNHFDDGHALMEICDPAERRWVLFDSTLGARYRHGGRWLNLLEMTRLYRAGGQAEIEFLNAGSKVDPLMDYDAYMAPGFPDKEARAAAVAEFMRLLKNDPQAIHRWYRRIMQIPLVGNDFLPDSPAEDALLRTLPCWKNLTRLSADEFRCKYYEDPCPSANQPAGRDYEYTLTETKPDPARHPLLCYLGGEPCVEHRLDAQPDTWISGEFRVPVGAEQLHGMAVKVSRDGRPGPLEVRLGTAPGKDDLGAAKIDTDAVLPLYDVWQEAWIDPTPVRDNQPVFWQLRATAGTDPDDHYIVYGPRPAKADTAATCFLPAYRVLTDRPQDRTEQPGKQYTFQHVKKLLGPYYCEDPALRLHAKSPEAAETIIDDHWSIHYVADREGVIAAAAHDLAQFLSVRAGVGVGTRAEPAHDSLQTIDLVVSDDAALCKKIDTEEGYRVEVRPDRVSVLGRHPRGVMRGVYWIEDLMRFRGGAILVQGVTDRNCRFRRRITTSVSLAERTYDAASHPLVYTDGLLQKISHQGFNAIWLNVNVEEVTIRSRVFPELNDPEAQRRLARLGDLVDRASPLGIDVILYLSTNYRRPVPESFYSNRPECRGVGWGNAMCTSHPDVRHYFGETVRGLFQAVPGLKGLVVIFDSEGFWHCALGNQQNCPRCHDREPDDIAVELLSTIRTAMKSASPDAELIAWSYGGAVAPAWVDDVIPKLPKGICFQSEFSKGTRVVRDGITNITEDYNITTVGPSDVFLRHYETARKAGLRVTAKTEHAVSQEFVSVPYIPCMRQWHERAAKMAEFELDGFFGNWCHYGYMPSRPAELLMWYSWSGAPPLEALLQQIARRDFGESAVPHVLAAWEHFTRGIRQYPYSDPIARYPGPIQKGPSQPLFLDPKIKSLGPGRAWQNDLDWTKPWGPHVAAKYLRRVEDEFAAGIDELRTARTIADPAGQVTLDGEIGISEVIRRSLHTLVHLIQWIPVRDAYAAATSVAERDPLRKQLVIIAQDELANAKAALAITEADSRLGATSEANGCRRGGLFTPALIRVKIGMLEDVLRQLANAQRLTAAGQFEDLGIPVCKAELMYIIIGPDRTGTKDMLYMNFMQEAAPLFLLAVDPDSGATQQFPAQQDHCAWASCLGPDNRIYVGTAGQGLILEFDPHRPELGLKTIGRPATSETYIWQLCVGKKDRKIYGCTYGSARLVSYDPTTGRLEDLGRMDTTQDYTRHIAAGPNGKIYTGVGMARQNLVVYDPATRTHKSLLDEKQRIAGYVGVVEGADGNVYATITGERSPAFRIDDETLVPVESIPAKPLALRDGRVVQGIVAEAQGGRFTVVDPKTRAEKAVRFAYEGAGAGIFMVGVGPKGCVYGSTFMPLEVFRYNPAGPVLTHLGNMPGGEVYSIIDYHGLLYLCSYGNAVMASYDPTNAVWKFGTGLDCNPRSFGSLGDGHMRPRTMIYGPHEMIYIGSLPPDGQWGGAMAVWNPQQNKVVENYRNLVQDQSIVALAYEPRSGLIFGGSGNYGGGGTRPTQKEAMFFAFDPVRKQKLYEMPLVPEAKTYHAMVAVDGRVFLALDRLYVFDPQKQAVIHSAPLPDGNQLDISLGVHSDGSIYGLTSRCIYQVDPKTYTIKELAKSRKFSITP